MAQTAAARPRWPAWAGTILCTLGFCVAAYLTFEHYTSSSSLSCPAGGGIVNCLKVTTSSYSMILGVPVAVLGLVFFAVMIVLQLPRSWASDNRAVVWGRVGWSVVGVGTAMWLIYAELFGVGAICMWCTTVHGLDIILFVTTALGTSMTMDTVSGPRRR